MIGIFLLLNCLRCGPNQENIVMRTLFSFCPNVFFTGQDKYLSRCADFCLSRRNCAGNYGIFALNAKIQIIVKFYTEGILSGIDLPDC